MKTYKGNLTIDKDTIIDFEEITGYLWVKSGVKFEAPNLKNQNDAEALAKALKKKGLVLIDDILSRLVSKKKSKDLTVYKLQNLIKTQTSYAVERANAFSHGKTLKEAIESLKYKLQDRDTSRFEAWKPSTKVTLEDAIQAYRAITGACEFGVKQFCEQTKIPKALTVAKVVEMTEGKYGNEKFREFFQK